MTVETAEFLNPVRRLKEILVIVDSCCSPEGQLNAIELARAGVSLILVDRNLPGAAIAANNLSLVMGWDPVDVGEASRVVSAKVGELSEDTAPDLAELALRKFGRLPDAVADVGGCVKERFLEQVHGLQNLGTCGLGCLKITLDYKTQLAKEGSHVEQDVLAQSLRAKKMMLQDLPARQPCLQVLCKKTALDKAVAAILSMELTDACVHVLTNNPISFLFHALSGNGWCPPFSVGRGVGTLHHLFRNKCTLLHSKDKTQFNDGSLSCLQEPGQQPSHAADDVDKVNTAFASKIDAPRESPLEDELLAVLDCRCQYEIIQKQMKRGFRWALLGYLVVMSTIPSLFLGSSKRF